MPQIEVDFDVFKAITLRRPTEEVSENEVLRQLLNLPPRGSRDAGKAGGPMPGEWISKGVRFPQGTELRASYKGETHLARVENGALVLHGKRFDTPSAAAVSITNNPVNGWTFWEARLPGRPTWQLLRSFRTNRGAAG